MTKTMRRTLKIGFFLGCGALTAGFLLGSAKATTQLGYPIDCHYFTVVAPYDSATGRVTIQLGAQERWSTDGNVLVPPWPAGLGCVGTDMWEAAQLEANGK